MDNPEKLATKGTQDEEKQNKNTTHDVSDTTLSFGTRDRCCRNRMEFGFISTYAMSAYHH
jgi:hypothetical protein